MAVFSPVIIRRPASLCLTGKDTKMLITELAILVDNIQTEKNIRPTETETINIKCHSIRTRRL